MNSPNYKGLVKADKDFCSNAISTQVRYIALGTMAVVWAILSGTNKELLANFGAYRVWLLISALLCILALVADLVQYQLALRAAKRANDALKVDESAKPWDDDWPSWKWRNYFFFIKQGLAVLAAGLLVVIIGLVLAVEPKSAVKCDLQASLVVGKTKVTAEICR